MPKYVGLLPCVGSDTNVALASDLAATGIITNVQLVGIMYNKQPTDLLVLQMGARTLQEGGGGEAH
jgi:hypothetical protein